MFDHVGLRVKDPPVSVAFYVAALKPLGVRPLAQDEVSAGFGQSDPVFWLCAGAPGDAHAAFKARSRPAVDAPHARLVAAAGRTNGVPDPRLDDGSDDYATFLTDPDSNTIEAPCAARAD